MYNWDGKESECYRLYVEERKSMSEVMQYWEQRGFTPSKRVFQTQFKRWGFPSKQNPAYKNVPLIARVKELWEANTTQKEMVDMLKDEGLEISDRELMRLRLKFNLRLRESNGSRRKRKVTGDESPKSPKKAKATPTGRGLIDQLANSTLYEEETADERKSDEDREVEAEAEAEADIAGTDQAPETSPKSTTDEVSSLAPQEVLRRQLRLEQLRNESDEKWRARKRRRRTRGWAGLPADSPGEPPRFPSETTLDESKAYLGMDNALYRQVREQFYALCQEEGVVKKTIAGPEKWGKIKDLLIQKNDHLLSVFQHDPEARQQNISMTSPSNLRALSLDVICMDVTKRMRTIDNRMSIPEAKNILKLNPEQVRTIRKELTTKLKADHFTTKHALGSERWEELKQEWLQESSIMVQLLAAGEADPDYIAKSKAVDVLARDVMKRSRDDNSKNNPNRQKQVNQGPGPGPAPPVVMSQGDKTRQRSQTTNPATSQSTTQASTTSHTETALQSLSSASDLQIDPSLLLAANESMIPDYGHEPANRHSYVLAPQFYSNAPLPAYFRLHPHSNTTMPNKTIWLGILQVISVGELRTLALREHPGTVVLKIEGLVMHKTHGQHDREITFAIDDDDELLAYLQHVAGGKATFVVLLALAQSNMYE
ncbi:hypothetical protein B0J11DRAFT_472863 [Dendryphion nanum]|uniref:Clr5 domain-containing protein n=1 Tax=Dendryphion nanum TaxID=256645 RepID=A0A9P9D4E7_9PLEO|nr:hypothetical protein B0J11DRAFT_472863 [Dendryphion nanum]